MRLFLGATRPSCARHAIATRPPCSHRAATGNRRTTRLALPGWAAKCQWRLLEWLVMDQPNAPAYRLVRRPPTASAAGPAATAATPQAATGTTPQAATET